MPPSMPHVAGVEHREVLVRGLRLHVALAGPTDGHPVVLVHGWPQHWYEWRHLIGPLAQAGYRVVAPDFRGFGWSEYPPDEDFLKETLVDDLIALCAELGHARVSLVGHDWGCWVGWLLCVRDTQLVDRAVLISVRPPFPAERIEPSDLARLAALWYQLVIASPLPRAAKFAFFRQMERAAGAGSREAVELDAFLQTISQPAQMRASTLLYRQFLTRELLPLIGGRYGGKRVTIPVRFLVGTEDPLYYDGIADEAAPHVDDYAGEVLPGIGHFIPEEVPDLLRDLVLELLDSPVSQGTVVSPR